MSDLRSKNEDKLIGVSKQYHDAIRNKNADKLEALFHASVTQYADGVAVTKDIVGSKDVKAYWKEFFDNYDFQRTESIGAVDENYTVAFSIVTDKATTPKSGKTKQPSNVISLTKLKIDENGQIKAIYLARQLRHDEAEAKLKKVPDYHGSSFNPEQLNNSDIKPSADNAKNHEKAAETWSKVFAHNDSEKVGEVVDPNIKVHNLLTSDQITGVDSYKNLLKNIFNDWKTKDETHLIAVTPGNKAFIFWQTEGEFKGKSSKVWGITLLVFNGSGKISEAAILHQPFPGQREALLK